MAAPTRRLFLGIPVPEDVSRLLDELVKELPGRSIPLENWHLTLHFLGNVEEKTLPLIHSALQSVTLGPSFELTFDHLGVFPHPKRARILWVGATTGTPEVSQLVQTMGTVLAPLGFTIDQRPYIPHLTVRRFSHPQNMAKLMDTHPIHPVSMTVERVTLCESILNQGPVHYIELNEYRLSRVS